MFTEYTYRHTHTGLLDEKKFRKPGTHRFGQWSPSLSMYFKLLLLKIHHAVCPNDLVMFISTYELGIGNNMHSYTIFADHVIHYYIRNCTFVVFVATLVWGIQYIIYVIFSSNQQQSMYDTVIQIY